MEARWTPAALRENLARLLLSPKDAQDALPGEDAVGLLEGEKDDGLETPARSKLVNTRSRRTYIFVGLAGLLLVLAAILLPAKASGRQGSKSQAEIAAQNVTRHDRYLHVVLPTYLGTVELCQTVLTGAVLNWPSPWLVNYTAAPPEIGGESADALAKLRGVSKWLDARGTHRDEDVVAIVSNPYSWFQVRPEVLIKRYLHARSRGDERLRDTLPSDVQETHQIETKIVFASETTCPPDRPQTCLAFSAEDRSVHYLSANLVVGSLKDLRVLWKTAVKHANAHAQRNETFDDSTIFAHIFKDQAQHRASLRGTAEDVNSTDTSVEDGDRRRMVEEREGMKGEKKEFGLTLDYMRELSYAAEPEPQGVEWMTHQTTKAPIPQDIAASELPFWTITGTDLPTDKTWADVPLLTGTKLDIVPALIHLQERPYQESSLWATWWKELWFHPYARQLLDAFVFVPLTPLAIVRDSEGTEVRYWSPVFEKVGVKITEHHKFLDWDKICRSEPAAEELFLDQVGLWKNPHY